MKHLQTSMAHFLSDETGQDLVEYALVACLVSLSAIAAMQTLASRISNMFTYLGTGVTNAI